MRTFSTFLLLLIQLNLFAQEAALQRIEPPNWWIGFKKPDFQILVYGKNISTSNVSVD